MAFNFNWSPLATDASFYERAKELLTNALNRAGPRPAIIVDDFLVNEFNLGDVPPDLEIVEIGDLAEDRFRGTFKMRYQGDAVLSLKTKVQANPLNTYLTTRSSFASPQPLAADTGLTIPLQITLSDIRLSGFIILVFSRQKGLTIVFKDDPLESLRVSSTFDSIPFVANYLQKEIEGQLRNLLMDELPAIIHRLSLRLWQPEHKIREDRENDLLEKPKEDTVIDPLASPPQDPVDSSGNVLSAAEIASLSLDSSIETQSLFSQRNLIRLATLTESHRTLSLFTPNIGDAVFRAWTGPLERGEFSGLNSRTGTPILSRAHSHSGSLSTTYKFDAHPQLSRQSSYTSSSLSHGLTTAGGRHSKAHGMRKRKKRVVNLRKQNDDAESEIIAEDSSVADTASVTESSGTAPSVFSAPPTTPSGMQQHRDLSSPETSPALSKQIEKPFVTDTRAVPESSLASPSRTIRRTHSTGIERVPISPDHDATMRAYRRREHRTNIDVDETPKASMYLLEKVPDMSAFNIRTSSDDAHSRQASRVSSSSSQGSLPNFFQFVADSSNGTSIAEQAWMMKMVSEMARKYNDEKAKGSFGSVSSPHDVGNPPPPAYAR